MIWNFTTFQSRNLPDDTFEQSSLVSVEQTDDVIIFQPTVDTMEMKVIFFHGGLTDPKAYGPICRKIAEGGFTCHLIKSAWRLPNNDYQKVLSLFDLEKGDYVIGGHSQGAKVAAQLVYENPSLFKGLFLLGSSNPKDIDLSNLDVPTMKLYAEKDGLASVEEVMQFKDKLPKNTNMVLIKGGNHSQFGYLGTLFMDNAADISREAQQAETLEHLLGFLKGIEGSKQ